MQFRKANKDFVDPGSILKPLGHGADFALTLRDLGEDVRCDLSHITTAEPTVRPKPA